MKFMAAAVLSTLAVGGVVEAQERASVAPRNMQAITPALADYTDNVLFGDVWLRPELASRDRSLVTVSALIAMGKTAQLTGHLNRALSNGVRPTEIAGAITHLAFYTGWPNAVSALNVVEEVFAARKIDVAALQQPQPARPGAAVPAKSGASDQDIASVAPKLSQLTNEVVLEDLWRRSDLNPRDRSLVTIAALTANGDSDQLASQLRRGLENGLTRAQIGEVLTHLAFYVGLPRATAAVAVAGTAFESDSDRASTVEVQRLTVAESGTQPRRAPATNFTGSVTVAASFKGSGDSRLGGATVSFQPGARTHWHTHPLGQLLIVTKGEGWMQAEGEPVRTVKAGDVVWTAPRVKHWHGATSNSAMTHVAVSEAREGEGVRWLEPVGSNEYRAR